MLMSLLHHDQNKQKQVTFLKPTCHLKQKAFSGFLNGLRLRAPTSLSPVLSTYVTCFSTEWFPLLQNLAACYKSKTSGPTPDLSQNLHFRKIPRGITPSVKSEEHCFRRTTDASLGINLHKELYFFYLGEHTTLKSKLSL